MYYGPQARLGKEEGDMNIDRVWSAINRVQNDTPADNSRAATYLRTYPALLAAVGCGGVDDKTKFLQLAMMTYGWMPRVLRLDSKRLNTAIEVLRLARLTSRDSIGMLLV